MESNSKQRTAKVFQAKKKPELLSGGRPAGRCLGLLRSHFGQNTLPKPELLSGAGDFAGIIAAVKNGADAVYFGVKGFNMRDLGTNFKESELKKVMSYLHGKNPLKKNVKGYLALNTIVFDEELEKVEQILKKAKNAGVDAIILWDLAVLSLAKKMKLNCFLSTQASVSNFLALKEYARLGVKRIILARELSLEQIKKITKEAHKVGVEVECFVHGAMCISVSGRCFLSHEAFGRSANRGECLQPCRRAFFPAGNPSREIEPSSNVFFLDGDKPNYEEKGVHLTGKTILSAKDLKAIEFLDKIIASGVDSLKIEGRTKPSDYVAATTKCYREAIDSVFDGTFCEKKIQEWDLELGKVYNREFSSGFYFSVPGKESLTKFQGSRQKQKRVNIGVVTKYYAKIGVAEIKLYNETGSINVGDKIIIEGKTTFLEQGIDSMQQNHKSIKRAVGGEMIGVKVNERVRPNDKVFVLKKK
jgi:putative protease